MTFKPKLIKTAAFAIGALAASTSLSLAGGVVDYGAGIRKTGAAVPVPAPEPVPDIPTNFYIRVDAAYAQGDTKKFKSTDTRVDSIRGDSYLDNFPRYGVGFGYYFNKWFRADITFDQRNDSRSSGTGQINYTVANTTAPGTTIAMRDTYSDSFTYSHSTGLFNGYLDIPASQSFTPYIGLGLGYVRHQVRGRNFSRQVACVDTVDCDPNTAGAQAGATGLNGSFMARAGGVNYQLATAVMAGFTYQVWDNTKLDIGYRWLHLEGATWAPRQNTTPETLKLPDQNIHEVRAGVRLDIN